MRNQRPGVASPGRPGFSLDPVVVCPGNLGSSLAFSWVSFSHLYSWMCLWWGTLECIFGPFLWFPARHGSCWAVVGCVPPTLLSSVPGPVPFLGYQLPQHKAWLLQGGGRSSALLFQVRPFGFNLEAEDQLPWQPAAPFCSSTSFKGSSARPWLPASRGDKNS